MLSAEDNALLTRTAAGTPMGAFFRRFWLPVIQDSQGFIADRTREHLGPTDTAIIEFRRLVLGGARNLGAGVEPVAAGDGAGYRVRGGSIVVDRRLSFTEVMLKRFGDPVGRVAG